MRASFKIPAIWILFLIIIVDGISLGLIIPLVIPLLKNASGDLLGPYATEWQRRWAFSGIMALFPLGALLGALFFGRLSDAIGRKKSLLCGLVGTFLSYLLLAVGLMHKGIGWLLVGRFLSGFAALGNRPIAQAAAADLSPSTQERAIHMSLIALAMTIAMALGPLLGGVFSNPHILQIFSITTPVLLTAFLAALNIVLLSVYFRDCWTPMERKRLPYASIKTMVKNTSAQPLWIIFFLLEAGWSLYFQSIPLFLNEYFGYQNTSLGLFLSYSGLWMCLGLTVVFRWALGRYSLASIGRVSFVVGACALMACVISLKFPLGQWLFVAPLAVVVGMSYTVLVSKLSQVAQEEARGVMMGITGALLALAWGVSGLLIAPLAMLGVWVPPMAAAVFLSASALLYWKDGLE